MPGPDLQGKLYILVGKYPKKASDPDTWLEWMHTHDRCVARFDRHVHFHRRERGRAKEGNSIHIVTSFCGVNMNYDTNGPPMLFETMQFEDGTGYVLDRYSTYYAALKGHGRHVKNYQENETTL